MLHLRWGWIENLSGGGLNLIIPRIGGADIVIALPGIIHCGVAWSGGLIIVLIMLSPWSGVSVALTTNHREDVILHIVVMETLRKGFNTMEESIILPPPMDSF